MTLFTSPLSVFHQRQLWEQPHHDELDRSDDEVLVDVCIADDVQHPLHILHDGSLIRRREVVSSNHLWYTADDGLGALALNLGYLLASRRHAGRRERIVWKGSEAYIAQEGRQHRWIEEVVVDGRGQEPAAIWR